MVENLMEQKIFKVNSPEVIEDLNLIIKIVDSGAPALANKLINTLSSVFRVAAESQEKSAEVTTAEKQD